MPQKAHVSSLEALELFRSNLIVYLSQARPALDEVSAEVMRTRVWLETEQCLHWENQMRRRTKELEQAQQALFSSRLGALRKETAAEQFAVHRAKAAVAEADLKLRIIRKWNREFEGRVQPLVKQMEKLHMVLSNDMVKAVTYLSQAINTLAAYAETSSESRTAGLSNTATGLGDLAATEEKDSERQVTGDIAGRAAEGKSER
jgi:hypothetical protein